MVNAHSQLHSGHSSSSMEAIGLALSPALYYVRCFDNTAGCGSLRGPRIGMGKGYDN